MGKQVNKDLRRKAKYLHEKMPEAFSGDFDNNKKKLVEMKIRIPKTELNIIAGLLVTLSRAKEI